MKTHHLLVLCGIFMIIAASSSMDAAISAANFNRHIAWPTIYIIHAVLLMGSLGTIVYAYYVEIKNNKNK